METFADDTAILTTIKSARDSKELLYLDGIKTLFQQRQIPRYVFGHKVKMERARQKEKYRT